MAVLRVNAENTATGVMHVYWYSERSGNFRAGLPYFFISLLLNVLLTIMIVIRLFLHTRNVRTVMGGAGSGGLCKAIVTMLIESCALYAVSSLAFIGAWGAGSYVIIILFAILSEVRVRSFLRPRFSDWLSNVTTDSTGHRSTAHHPASR